MDKIALDFDDRQDKGVIIYRQDREAIKGLGGKQAMENFFPYQTETKLVGKKRKVRKETIQAWVVPLELVKSRGIKPIGAKEAKEIKDKQSIAALEAHDTRGTYEDWAEDDFVIEE